MKDTPILHICAPTNYPGPYQCFDLNSNPLDVGPGTGTQLTLRMIPGFLNNRFEIWVNEPILGITTGRKRRELNGGAGRKHRAVPELRQILLKSHKFRHYLGTFHNVKVYRKTPWDKPSAAIVNGYKFKSDLDDYNQYELVKKLYPLYRVRLNVRMTGATKPGVTNLMHVGDQITMNIPPNSRKLEICLNANGQVCVTTDRDDLSWKRDTEIEVCL